MPVRQSRMFCPLAPSKCSLDTCSEQAQSIFICSEYVKHSGPLKSPGLHRLGPVTGGFLSNKSIGKFFWYFLLLTKQSYRCFFVIKARVLMLVNRYFFHVLFQFWCLVLVTL